MACDKKDLVAIGLSFSRWAYNVVHFFTWYDVNGEKALPTEQRSNGGSKFIMGLPLLF